MAVPQVKEDVWIKSFCQGCLSATCGIMVHRVDGVVVGIEGDYDNPHNHGKLCAKAYAAILTLYDPYRPRQPLIRTNPTKGIGVDPQWKEVSWEEALTLVAQKLAEVHKTNPADLCLSSTDISAINWVPGPMLASFGTPNKISSSGYYCAAAVHTAPYASMGSFHMYPDLSYCNHLVLWGSNKGGGIQHSGTTMSLDMANARIKRGLKLVCIDPVQSNIGAKADEWVPIRPGTDMALALAWTNVMLHDGDIYDEEFLKKYTNAPYLVKSDGRYFRDRESNKPMVWDPVEGVAKPYDAESKDVAIVGTYCVRPVSALALNGGCGDSEDVAALAERGMDQISCRPAFDLLREHVQDCTPEWAASITGVPAPTIRRLAREYGEAARIGSTIKIEGHIFPYRPAAVHWFAGISGHVNGTVTGMAIQLINTLVGNLLVPGGMLGEGVLVEFPYGQPTTWTGKDSEPQEVDGLIYPSQYARFGGRLRTGYPAAKVEPPRTAAAVEMFPVGMSGGRAIFEINNLHPERFNHKIPRPKVLLTRHGSDITNRGNPQEVAQVLGNFFQISCEPLVDETAEFADVFLPVPVRLERLQIGTELPGYSGATVDLEHYCINLSQPAVLPFGREMLDIWGEITDRLGIRAEFNQLVNILWDLQGEYRLEVSKKYSYAEMQQLFCKSLFGPNWDLKTLGEAGHIAWRKSVRELYPRIFIKPRSPIYYEHFLDAGEKLSKLTGELGFEWDTEDYRPLPTWRPGPSLRGDAARYDLMAIPFRVPFLTHMWQTHNPWLAELGEAHPWAFKIMINAATAAAKGIKDGDKIELESEHGHRVEGRAKLTQCVHPEVIAIGRHGGHWAAHPIAKGKGVHFNTLVPHSTEFLDLLYGGLEGCIRVKVVKSTSK